jgi:hypothetical protein
VQMRPKAAGANILAADQPQPVEPLILGEPHPGF